MNNYEPFNINKEVKVKLTQTGIDIYKTHYNRLGTNNSSPRIDNAGYTGFQLWDLMKIYGNHLSIGSWESPFDTTILISQSTTIEHSQKVKVPKFVAEELKLILGSREKHDVISDICLVRKGYGCGTPFEDKFISWCEEYVNLEMVIKAIWDGYEIEEEPKYYVKVPYSGSFYWKTGNQNNPIGTASGNSKWTLKNCEFTQKEIDNLLPEVEKFKVPVEKEVAE